MILSKYSWLYDFNSSQVNLQAAKAQFERDLAAKEDSIEEGRRSLVKQVSSVNVSFATTMGNFFRFSPLKIEPKNNRVF